MFETDGGIAGNPPEGFSYFPNFLALDEQEALLCQIHDLDFKHDTFRGTRLRRGYAQFGYAYVSTGRKLRPAQPLPAFLKTLIEKATPLCLPKTPFNQCIVTWYPEDAGIGWHVDAPCFDDCIIAVSLGGGAILQFRTPGSETVSCEAVIRPGSLYIISGSSRWDYQHQVIPVEAVRYSITFRNVANSI